MYSHVSGSGGVVPVASSMNVWVSASSRPSKQMVAHALDRPLKRQISGLHIVFHSIAHVDSGKPQITSEGVILVVSIGFRRRVWSLCKKRTSVRCAISISLKTTAAKHSLRALKFDGHARSISFSSSTRIMFAPPFPSTRFMRSSTRFEMAESVAAAGGGAHRNL